MQSPHTVSHSAPEHPQIDADLSIAFAQKYLQQVNDRTESPEIDPRFVERQRQVNAQKMMTTLRSVSAKAWVQTENLLAQEIVLHNIDASLIDPWQVSEGIYQVYKLAIAAYTAQKSPHSLVRQVSPILGNTRQQVTAIDPRVIGFVAMQYHYTGVQLLELLSPAEQALFLPYVSVLDDHLYMPLQRAYRAAARHSSDSVVLQAVRRLMEQVDEIADRIVTRVIELYPRYQCYSGRLDDPSVRASSVRDVIMFQAYMWVCLLEGDLQALQEELFALCLMIYPRLNVSWELVRQMTFLLRKEVEACLNAEQNAYCQPYYDVLLRLFSMEVFANG